MPEIKKTFTSGVMDMGTDARLLPDGVYRHALNIDVAGSESSDQGVIQNIRGNTSRVTDFEIPDDNPIVIGTATDEVNSRIYYFWVSRESEGIYEYDVSEINDITGGGTLRRILEFNTSDNKKPFFNFSVEHLITGAVVLDDLLIWTDGLNPVRKINIDRFRGSGNLVPCPSVDNPEDNTSSIVCPADAIPRRINEVDYYLESQANPNYDGLGEKIIDDTFDDEIFDNSVGTTNYFSSDLINLAKKAPLFPPTVSTVIEADGDGNYTPDQARPEDKLYDEFARFAIRYRYTDGETTPFSPFSLPVFTPRRYKLNNDTGILESMVNSIKKCNIVFDVGESEVKEIDILYKESDSSTVFIVDTINKEADNITNSTIGGRKTFTYTYENSKIYRLLPTSELNRIYDNIPVRARTLAIAGNRLVLGNYTENRSLNRNSEDGVAIVPRYNLSIEDDAVEPTVKTAFPTCKTGRDYQVGLVYLDEQGRQSPVTVSSGNTVHIPVSDAGKRNRLKLSIESEAPYWATHYRPFVKQSRGTFYNIIPRVTWWDTTSKMLYIGTYDADVNKGSVGDIISRKIYGGEIDGKATNLRIVETKRLIEPADGTMLEGVSKGMMLPSDLDSDNNTQGGYEGFFWLCSYVDEDDQESETRLSTDDVFETIPPAAVGDFYWETPDTFRCYNGRHTSARAENLKESDRVQGLSADGSVSPGDDGKIEITMSWFNCFGYASGIESMVIEDKFNGVTLDQGARASTVQDEFEQYDRNSWLIHSGIYIDSSNLNRLNDFNVSENRAKDLDISDGSIQHIHFRDTNLYVFQERKVKNVPINKNVIQSAGGGNLTTGGSSYFGTEFAYQGNYGISRNPESFASYGDRMYFADKNRGAIMRLAGNGLTEISKNGMEAYIRKYIADADHIKIFSNDYSDEIDISFQNIPNLDPANGNRRIRRISTKGTVGPQSGCHTDLSGLDFEDYYFILQNANEVEGNRGDFTVGDTVYVDAQYNNPFRGEYNWYRVETATDSGDTYDTVIQITPDGVVGAVIESCRTTYPKYIGHITFNISEESFMSEIDACANGILNDVAYHDGLGREPIVGNKVYESKTTLIQTNRNGWYKINANNGDGSFTYYVVFILDGVITKRFNCERIALGRFSKSGSEVIPDEGKTEFDRHIDLCTAELEHDWWFELDLDERQIGEVVYQNNYNDDVAGEGYLALTDGVYLTIDSTGAITAISDCADRICDPTPYDTFVPDNGYALDADATIAATRLSDSTDTLLVLRADDLHTVTLTGGQEAFEDGDLVELTFLRTEGSDNLRTRNVRARVVKTTNNLDLHINDPKGELVEQDDTLTYTYAIEFIRSIYTFKFLGFEAVTDFGNDTNNGTVRIGVPTCDLYFIEIGEKTYPYNGESIAEFRAPEGEHAALKAGLIYKISNLGNSPEYNTSIVFSEACYDKVIGGTASTDFAYTSYGSEATAIAGYCEQTTVDTLYFNPDDVPKVYYTSPSLDPATLFTAANNQFVGIVPGAEGAVVGTGVTFLEQVGADGVVNPGSRVDCNFKDKITLAYSAPDTDALDDGHQACGLFDDGTTQEYWADAEQWDVDHTPAVEVMSEIRLKDGKGTRPPNGTYADQDSNRTSTNGVLSTTAESCPTPLVTKAYRYNANNSKDACDSTVTQSPYTTNTGALNSEVRLYQDAFSVFAFMSGYYSDGVMGGFWNAQLEDWVNFGACDNSMAIDQTDPNDDENDTNDTDIGDTDDDNDDDGIDDGPVCQTSKTTVLYRGGNKTAACVSTSPKSYHYTGNTGGLDDPIWTNCYANSAVASGWFRGGPAGLVSQWDGSSWGSESQCINRQAISVTSGTVQQACGNVSGGTSITSYFDGSFSSASNIYAGTMSESPLTGQTGFYSVNGFYRSVDTDGSLGTYTACPPSEPTDCLYESGVTWTAASSGLTACKNHQSGSRGDWISDSSSLNSASIVADADYDAQTCDTASAYDFGNAVHYSDGSIYRKFNGTSFDSPRTPCSRVCLSYSGAVQSCPDFHSGYDYNGSGSISGTINYEGIRTNPVYVKMSAYIEGYGQNSALFSSYAPYTITVVVDGVQKQTQAYTSLQDSEFELLTWSLPVSNVSSASWNYSVTYSLPTTITNAYTQQQTKVNTRIEFSAS